MSSRRGWLETLQKHALGIPAAHALLQFCPTRAQLAASASMGPMLSCHSMPTRDYQAESPGASPGETPPGRPLAVSGTTPPPTCPSLPHCSERMQ